MSKVGFIIHFFIILFLPMVGKLHAAANEFSWEGEVTKVSDQLYLGTVKGKPHLSLVMQNVRYNKNALYAWRKFAAYKKTVAETLESPGLDYFKSVLNDSDLMGFGSTEVWVSAIVSRTVNQLKENFKNHGFIGPAKEDIDYENSKDEREKKLDVHIACTVASSPRALITGHMGIENYSSTERQISLPLHSFAAKVMLMRNPERRFMINAPVWAMLHIMAKVPELKGHLFLGTLEMEKQLLLKKPLMGKLAKGNLKEFIVAFKQSSDYEGEKIFNARKLEFWRDFSYRQNTEVLLEDLEKFPPIISVHRGEDKKTNGMTVFEPSDRLKIAIEISKQDPDYSFVFSEPFLPGSGTYYIAVDLKALAAEF
jgi:hypothetical protein